MRKIIAKLPVFNKAFLIKNCLMLFLIACYITSFANVNTPDALIHGKVVDSKGVALAGATVTEKATTNTTTTNTEGVFNLNTRNQTAVLVVSYVGYTTKEVPVNGSSRDLVIELTSFDSSLQTVIVVGYGTQKKISSTAAISTVKGDELAEAPVANISNALAGRVSGVMMNANGGRPGADNPDIYIRGIATTGNANPLIVVDGVIRNNINEVDPTTIASVTVLKDAAAVAPYGLGGANGVILITTKRGDHSKPTLSFGGYYGDQKPTYVPKMLSAQDYMRLRNEAYLNDNPGSSDLQFSEDLISSYAQKNAEDPDRYPISDALNTVVSKHAPMGQAGLQLRGGTNTIRYFAGLSYFDQKGLFDPVGYRRYNYNVNLDMDVTPTTLVSLSLNGAYQKTDNVDANSSTDQLLRATYKFIPIANLLYSNGLWGEFAGNAPLGVLNAGGYDYINTTNLLSTISIEQKLPFIKGLSVKAAFSYDPYNTFEKQWHKPFVYWSQDLTTTPYTYTKQISSQEGGAATYTWLNENYYQNNSYTYQGYLNYHNTFGKSEITGLVVAEARNNKQLNFNARRNNFAVDIDELSLGSSDRNDYDNGGASSTGSQIGYVYRLNYGYDNRYLLEASGRYDGHYYFAPSSRWAYFPAFSLGWVVSNEKFFQSVKNIDYLKFRGSWGKSGNLAGDPFQYLNGYTLYGNAYGFGSGRLVQGSYLPIEANPNITWEVANKADVGFEANLWRGLLRLEVDYFTEKRTGMLLPPQVTVPVEYGLSLAQENAGIMKNRGIEITVGSHKKLSNGLQLGLDGNFSYAKNKMIQVFETPVTKNDPRRSRTGRPLNTLFGYHSLGLFKTVDDKNGDGIINQEDGYSVVQFGDLHPGDIQYADLSGPDGKPDGKIDSYDETVIGDPNIPAITYGANLSASWKGFDLSLFFQGSAMSSRDVRGFITIPFNNNNSNSTYEYYNNRWTPETQNAKYPRANQSPYSNNNQASDFWIIKTSYIRLKTAVLGYTLPVRISKKIGMQNLRLYATGENVFTASNLKFTDPQTNGETGYPLMKSFIFGLNASF
jgi:TonB-linked SusC/RagA family outer membrane protein